MNMHINKIMETHKTHITPNHRTTQEEILLPQARVAVEGKR